MSENMSKIDDMNEYYLDEEIVEMRNVFDESEEVVDDSEFVEEDYKIDPIGFKCSQCDHESSNEYDQELHILMKHTPPSSTCNLCNVTVHNIKNHLDVVHNKIYLESVKNDSVKSLYTNSDDIQCKFCSVKFPVYGLMGHIKTVHRSKQLLCNICNKYVKTISAMGKHRKTTFHQKMVQGKPVEVTTELHHSVYGSFKSGFRPIKGYEGMYEVNEHSQVRSLKTNSILSPDKTYKIRLSHRCDFKHYDVFRLALETFFPQSEFFKRPDGDTTKHTIDHIDNNYQNNHVCNLQHMTFAENVRKANNSPDRKNQGITQSKGVWKCDKDGLMIDFYESVKIAGIKNKISPRCVSESARTKKPFQGLYFMFHEQPDLEGEEWYTSEVLKSFLSDTHKNDTFLSNKGRIKRNGVITEGVKSRSYKIRTACVGGKRFGIHQLLYMAYYNKLCPLGRETDENGNLLVIKHNDFAPLRPDGTYRNWLEDLEVGTQSENLSEHHVFKRRQREEKRSNEAKPKKKLTFKSLQFKQPEDNKSLVPKKKLTFKV